MLHKMKQEKASIEKSISDIQAHIDIQEMMFKFPKKVLEDEC